MPETEECFLGSGFWIKESGTSWEKTAVCLQISGFLREESGIFSIRMEAIMQTSVHKDIKSDVREKYEDDNLNYLPDIGMRKRNKKDTIKNNRGTAPASLSLVLPATSVIGGNLAQFKRDVNNRLMAFEEKNDIFQCG